MARIIKDSEYVCSLSTETQKKAKAELGEDPDNRLVFVKELRSRVEKISGLKARTDIGFLLSFLRARKFEPERSFQLVKNYYEVRKDAEVFDDLKPSRIKHVIDDGILEVLKERDSKGCRVVILRLGRWDPDRYPLIDIPRTLFLILSKLVEDEETQVHGVHFINNLADISWKQAKHLTPGLAKRFLHILQDVLPLRLKRLDYANEPTFFDVIFTIVKQFMKEKLKRRIHLNGTNYENIGATMSSPDHLPTDLGGKAVLYSNTEWIASLMSSDAYFEEENKYGYLDMKLKKEKQQADADMQGMAGSFKKLDV